MPQLFSLSAQAEVQPCDDKHDTVLVVLGGKRFYHLTGLARSVVLAATKTPLSEDAIRSLGREFPAIRSDEDLRPIITGLIDRNILIVDGAETAKIAPRRSSVLLVSCPILSRNYTAALAGVFKSLCSPSAVRLLLPVLFCVQVAFLVRYSLGLWAYLPHLGLHALLLLIFLNYTCLFFHELGHAAGCLQSGVPPGRIGIGIYLYMPVFYVDVSQVWRLPARARVLTDACGLYVSLLLALACSAVFMFRQSVVLGILAILIDISVLANLNPFLRMDGYWLISDFLGLEDLMALNKRTTHLALQWCLRRNGDSYPFRGLPGLYRVYYVGFVTFSLWLAYNFFVHMLPACLYGVRTLVDYSLSSVHGAPPHASQLATLTLRILSVLIPTALLAFYLLQSLFQLTDRKIRNVSSKVLP